MNTSKQLATLSTRFEQRFGPQYFQRLPDAPGIFWINDSRRQLLLVGQSQSLQKKLLMIKSFLNHPRSKMDGEIEQQIHDIHWEEFRGLNNCISKELNQKYQAAYKLESVNENLFQYIHFIPCKSKFVFKLSTQKKAELGWSFGAFKRGSLLSSAYSALLRWARFYYYGGSIMSWPSPFNKSILPLHLQIPLTENKALTNEKMALFIVKFFSGESKELLVHLTESLDLQRDHVDQFTRLWLHKDLERLERFYRLAARKNFTTKNNLNIEEFPLDPEWVSPIKIAYNV